MSIKLHQLPVPETAAPAREIVFRAGALGDFLLTLPLLQALAGTGRPLLLVSRPAYGCLLPADVNLEAFVDAEGPDTAALYAPAETAPAAFRERLPGARLHFFVRKDAALEARLRRFGAAEVVWHDPRPSGPPHAACRFLAAAGFPAPPALLTRPILDGRSRRRRPGPAILWLHPGSGSRAKNWPITVFAKFAAAWQYDRRGAVMVSSGPADRELAGPCRAALREFGAAAEFLDRPALGELRDRLAAEADLYIGNDSGVTHLAAALGVPTVALFRCTDPRVWRPLGNTIVLPHEWFSSPLRSQLSCLHLPMTYSCSAGLRDTNWDENPNTRTMM
ncbi:MAG: glycosyltransferase family 9 protein [Kiritimatiellaeota bacterium]|nr:glycosyltransferase family 9 protein [Kiritimatiellota bacterium]